MESIFEDVADDEELARLGPSVVRFWFGVAMTLGLSVLMLYVTLFTPQLTFLGRILFFGLSLCAGLVGMWLYRNGRQALVLTKAGISDTRGRIVAPIGNIRSVERGFVTFKPSNGFVVFLDEPMPRAWEPGLWWRIGRRVGAGGTTAAAPAKDMADILTMLVKERSERTER